MEGTIGQREEYTPRARVERFIVPLLAGEIRGALERHARGPAKGARALDAGCGGQPLRGMIEGLGWEYHSLDARQNAAGTVEFVAPIDGELPAGLRSSGPFGLVVCTEVLEHVADWGAAWRNLSSVLARGGRAVVTVPQVYPPHEEPFDFWRPTTHAVEHWAGRSGLRVVELKRLGDGFDVLGTVLSAFKPSGRKGSAVGAIVAGLMRLRRRFAVAALTSRWIRGRVEDRGTMYLSVLAVLEKA